MAGALPGTAGDPSSPPLPPAEGRPLSARRRGSTSGSSAGRLPLAAPRHPAADTTPALPAEVAAWYAIDVGNSVYSSVGVSGFLPLLLQSAALAAAGFPARCGNVVTDAAAIAAAFPASDGGIGVMYRVVRAAAGGGSPAEALCDPASGPQCAGDYCAGLPPTTSECLQPDGVTPQRLSVGPWGGVDPTGYASLSLALSVMAQAVVFVGVAAAADHGPQRKRLLVGSAVVGGLLTVACAAIGPDTWWLGAPLMIASNVAFGVGSLCQNAYLPLLVSALPEVAAAAALDDAADAKEAVETGGGGSGGGGGGGGGVGGGGAGARSPATPGAAVSPTASFIALGSTEEGGNAPSSAAAPGGAASTRLPAPGGRRRWAAALMSASSRLSSVGFAWGYAAGVVGILSVLPLSVTLAEIPAYQGTMVFVGLWWLLWAAWPALRLRSRPGPPLPPGVGYVSLALRRAAATARELCHPSLRVSGLYLLVWMIGSDAVFTVGNIGGLYANSQVTWTCAGPTKAVGILIMFLLVPITAGIGNIGYLRIAQRGWATPRTLLAASMLAVAAMAVYGLLGGMTTGLEMIVFGAWYGLHMGAYQAFSRSIFSTLVPPGKESTFYAAYELTNKGSSALGPLVLTALQAGGSHDLRWGFVFVCVNIALPVAMLLRLDLAKGAAAAAAYGAAHADAGREAGDGYSGSASGGGRGDEAALRGGDGGDGAAQQEVDLGLIDGNGASDDRADGGRGAAARG